MSEVAQKMVLTAVLGSSFLLGTSRLWDYADFFSMAPLLPPPCHPTRKTCKSLFSV